VEWRPLQHRAEMMLDVMLRGLLRDPFSAAGISVLPAKDAGPSADQGPLAPDLPKEEK